MTVDPFFWASTAASKRASEPPAKLENLPRSSALISSLFLQQRMTFPDPLENTSGSVPEDGLGLQDGLPEELVGLFTTVEPLPVGLDTLGVGSGTTLGVVGKVFGGDVVCALCMKGSV
jgi:hypothetical protein